MVMVMDKESVVGSLEAARSSLARLSERQQLRAAEPRTKAQKIAALGPEIRALRVIGTSWEDIAEALQESVGATSHTIRGLMTPKKSAVQASGKKRKRVPLQ